MERQKLDMEIIGLGIVAICYFVGNFVGRLLGVIIGIGGNVGGVGIGMLLLVVWSLRTEKHGGFSPKAENGIKFLSAIYIPVIVAMAAQTNVVLAINGGAIAFLAGGVATIASILIVPMISKIGRKKVTASAE